MTQIVGPEDPSTLPKRVPPKFALIGLVFFVVIAALFTVATSINALYVTLKWQATHAPVIGHETSVSTSKFKTQTTYRPIFEVTDQSGEKSRAVSKLGYNSTKGMEIGDVVSIRHNGQGDAISNSFGARFSLPIVGLAITMVLGFALHHTHQRRKAASTEQDAGQEILRS